MIWFVLLCLVLTAYRATRLITKDDFPPLLWLRDRIKGGWRPLTEPDWTVLRAERPAGAPKPFPVQDIDGQACRWVDRASWVPHWLAELYGCPWCVSAYVSGVLVAVTDVTYGLPVPWLVAPAVWAAAAVLASRDGL